MNSRLEQKDVIRFTRPVIAESILAIALSLLTSVLIGRISGSSLAIVGISNTAFTIGICAFAMLTNTPAILTARMIGAGENGQASEVIEQSIFFAAAGGLFTAAVIEIFSLPIVRILMPNADSGLISETVLFFRIFGLSFPFMLLYNTLTGVMRSSGNSVIPMAASILMNLLHLMVTWLMIYGFKLGTAGVGISYTVCRFIGMGIILTAVLRNDYNFHVSIKKIFRPKFRIFMRMFKIGLPISVESVLVQGGYLAANVMAVGLGIQNAAAFQVANTINLFLTLPQGISNAVSLVTSGQLLGAGEYKKAKKNVWNILYVSMAATMLIGLPIAAGGRFVSSFYSSDGTVIAESAKLLWILLLTTVPAIFINVFDPVLRNGGDPKFVMTSAILGVWLFRIPLTYLFCFRLNMGVAGIFLGNLIGLTLRSTSNVIRFQTGKWLHKEI